MVPSDASHGTRPLGPVDTGKVRPGPGTAGAVGRVLVAVACFAATVALLRTVASPGGGPLVGAKRELWRARAGEVDTVFLGSSHVYRGVLPAEFDRVAAAAGRQTRSFNFGVQLPNLVECRYLVRELLATGPRLERIFLEVQTLTPQIDPQNAFQPRSVYWHDLPSTVTAVERTLHWGAALGDGFTYAEERDVERSLLGLANRALPAPWRVASEHVQHALVNGLLVGRGKDVGRGLLGRRHGQTARLADEEGYVSLEEEDRRLAAQGQPENPYSRRAQRFAETRDEYAAAVEALTRERRVFGDEEWMNAALLQVHDTELLRAIADDVRAAGVELVLVILPQQSADREVEARLAAEVGAPLLRYNLPERYPELYAPEMRFDSGHLSAAGALLFTHRLARDWLAVEEGVQ